MCLKNKLRKRESFYTLFYDTDFFKRKAPHLGFLFLKKNTCSTVMLRRYLFKRKMIWNFSLLYLDEYDVIVSSGAFGEGHIPCTGLQDMVRIVKPGKDCILLSAFQVRVKSGTDPAFK